MPVFPTFAKFILYLIMSPDNIPIVFCGSATDFVIHHVIYSGITKGDVARAILFPDVPLSITTPDWALISSTLPVFVFRLFTSKPVVPLAKTPVK